MRQHTPGPERVKHGEHKSRLPNAQEMLAGIAKLRQDKADMLATLEKVQQDINWMLNNQQFLNPHVFEYLDVAIDKAQK